MQEYDSAVSTFQDTINFRLDKFGAKDHNIVGVTLNLAVAYEDQGTLSSLPFSFRGNYPKAVVSLRSAMHYYFRVDYQHSKYCLGDLGKPREEKKLQDRTAIEVREASVCLTA